MTRKIGWIWIGTLIVLILTACNLPQPSSATPTSPPLPAVEVGSNEPSSTVADCLVGNWTFDPSQIETGWIESQIRQMTGQQVTLRETSGRLIVQFLPDGQVIGYAQDFDLHANVSARGARLPVQVSTNGSVQASYRFDEPEQSLVVTGPLTGWEDAEISARVLILTVFDGNAGEFVSDGMDTNGSVTLTAHCSGDTLQLTTNEEAFEQKSFQLERAP